MGINACMRTPRARHSYSRCEIVEREKKIIPIPIAAKREWVTPWSGRRGVSKAVPGQARRVLLAVHGRHGAPAARSTSSTGQCSCAMPLY